MDPRGLKYASLYANDVHGWFHHGDALLQLIEDHHPLRCVELGSWMGSSAIPIARLIHRWGGILYCIDHWEGNPSFPPELMRMVPTAQAAFRRNIANHRISNVTIYCSDSVKAAEGWPDGWFDFVYVDACHEEKGVRADLDAWWRVLRPGGVIAGDDYGVERFSGLMDAWHSFGENKKINFQNGRGNDGLVWIVK